MADAPRNLSVERIREVLAAWPPEGPAIGATEVPLESDVALAADYHRIIAIHRRTVEGGVGRVRASIAAQLHSEVPAEVVAEALPAGDAFGSRRMAALREDRHEATRATLARLDAIAPDEEAAVAACCEEIEAVLSRLREP